MPSISDLLFVVSVICSLFFLVVMIMSLYWGQRLSRHLLKNYYPDFKRFGDYRFQTDFISTLFIKTHPEDKQYNQLRRQYRVWTVIGLLFMFVALPFVVFYISWLSA